MTAIVGIDTRTRTMHWVSSRRLGAGDGDLGTLDFDPKVDQEGARRDLFWYAHGFFRKLPEESHVFCEEPLALRMNPNTTRELCLAAGAVWSAFQAVRPNAYWWWCNPAKWKKAVLGRGLPPKGQKHKPWIEETLYNMEEFNGWVRDRPRTSALFLLEPDLLDAWCLMRYGVSVVESAHGRTAA